VSDCTCHLTWTTPRKPPCPVHTLNGCPMCEGTGYTFVVTGVDRQVTWEVCPCQPAN